MKMKLLLVVMMCVWLILAPAQGQQVITFRLTASNFRSFLTNLRNAVQLRGRTCHRIPMLDRPTTTTYLLVVLHSGLRDNTNITLTIDTTTLYVEGYSDWFVQGTTDRCRSFVFRNAHDFRGAENSLCRGEASPIRQRIEYNGRYSGLEAQAGKRRGELEIGIKKLNQSMVLDVYGKPLAGLTSRNQARFLLTAVQVVSEATRFGYIERQVYGRPAFVPNPKMVKLQDEWGKISAAIERAPRNGAFPAPLRDLVNETGHPWVVTNVDQIRPDIALLNHAPACTVSSGTPPCKFDSYLRSYLPLGLGDFL